MKAGQAVAGESRSCPHCKATILKSAATCPICRHNVRFAAFGAEPRNRPTSCPLWVEGTLKNTADGAALEYFVLMEVRDEAGKVISRQSIGVGAIPKATKRIFSLRIETTPV
ncbi:MAG TPA: hypothetical protein VFK65_11670 [Candidatus Binatia bacterium]|jgi:hypothetical protein|nr:hypothetical protein [Candidatus Binatia bacterium]